jgi:hypothetical protein
MSQIILPIVIGYGAPYVVRFVADKVTTAVLKKTTKIVKKKINNTIFYNNDPLDLEYEYISVDDRGNVVIEPVMYVTSRDTVKGIDQSWADISIVNGREVPIRPSSSFCRVNELSRISTPEESIEEVEELEDLEYDHKSPIRPKSPKIPKTPEIEDI